MFARLSVPVLLARSFRLVGADADQRASERERQRARRAALDPDTDARRNQAEARVLLMVEALDEGRSYREVAAEFRTSPAAVHRATRAYRLGEWKPRGRERVA